MELAQSSVLTETERLSAGHSEKLGTRSLDVLHVAMAVCLGCRRFLSFDTRQIKLAQAVGLKAPKLLTLEAVRFASANDQRDATEYGQRSGDQSQTQCFVKEEDSGDSRQNRHA